MSSQSLASISAGLLARKGEAKPTSDPQMAALAWQPTVVPTNPSAPPSRPAFTDLPASVPASGVADAKVPLQDVAAAWPAKKPPAPPVDDAWPAKKPSTPPVDDAWVATKSSPPLEHHGQHVKTSVRLTHAQSRAVRLAALVLDKPQQEILAAGLMSQLEALACTDLANCKCFQAVVAGLEKPVEAKESSGAAEHPDESPGEAKEKA